MIRWEYKKLTKPSVIRHYDEALVAQLNAAGAEGWEVCAYQIFGGEWWLKRPLSHPVLCGHGSCQRKQDARAAKSGLEKPAPSAPTLWLRRVCPNGHQDAVLSHKQCLVCGARPMKMAKVPEE